ncbi:hypothetical protein [Bradyrhizobium diazoefficiens]|uniref:hypothetical protein n=1 Tax=Bradyrhizobium diazoefficiens TaxID=1355477 RepID=UPI00272B617B|nr:hypothetical protein [Bradyrhizobium diazoefficiens]WLA68076.1 hypothetical protein QNN01_16250 [Bradyrhizobium diazoefficiens]
MVYQTQSNGLIAYKKPSGLGTPASGSGATQLRFSARFEDSLLRALKKERSRRSKGNNEMTDTTVHV